jgi:ribosomal protein S14
MNRIRLLLAVLLAASAALPAAALAHRQASNAERAAVLTAVVRQHQLSGAQAACQVVTISTVNRGYAAVTWPQKLSRACLRVAANGLIIERRAARGWTFVTVGSSFHCPINGVPTPVARDLNVCS